MCSTYPVVLLSCSPPPFHCCSNVVWLLDDFETKSHLSGGECNNAYRCVTCSCLLSAAIIFFFSQCHLFLVLRLLPRSRPLLSCTASIISVSFVMVLSGFVLPSLSSLASCSCIIHSPTSVFALARSSVAVLRTPSHSVALPLTVSQYRSAITCLLLSLSARQASLSFLCCSSRLVFRT